MTLGEGFVENIDESSIKPTVTAGTSYYYFWENFFFSLSVCIVNQALYSILNHDIDIENHNLPSQDPECQN